MQVFFSKKVNFLCICSDTQKVLFVKTKAHDPYWQMHSESHAFSVSSIYNTIYPHPTASRKQLSSASMHPYQKLHLIDIQLYLYIVKIRCIIYTIISKDCIYARIAPCFYRI